MEQRHSYQIDRFKLILILGVVLKHSNLALDYPMGYRLDNIWLRICNEISTTLCSVCVPCFFIISGLLFFRNIDSFTVKTYKNKLFRRFHSLFIPYMTWCAICCLLLFIKHRCFDFPGSGIFLDNGEIDLRNFIKGFWSIDGYDGFPYAFAFWFIRNLMVFCALSPIVYMIAKRNWATAITIILYLTILYLTGSPTYGFIWFLVGAYFSLHSVSLTLGKRAYCVLAVLYLLCTVLMINGVWYEWAKSVSVPCAFFLLYMCASQFKTHLTNATFMIYATHQCYSSTVRHLYEHMINDNLNLAPAAYLLTFLTLVGLGIAINALMDKYLRPLRPILSGNR